MLHILLRRICAELTIDARLHVYTLKYLIEWNRFRRDIIVRVWRGAHRRSRIEYNVKMAKFLSILLVCLIARICYAELVPFPISLTPEDLRAIENDDK